MGHWMPVQMLVPLDVQFENLKDSTQRHHLRVLHARSSVLQGNGEHNYAKFIRTQSDHTHAHSVVDQ